MPAQEHEGAWGFILDGFALGEPSASEGSMVPVVLDWPEHHAVWSGLGQVERDLNLRRFAAEVTRMGVNIDAERFAQVTAAATDVWPGWREEEAKSPCIEAFLQGLVTGRRLTSGGDPYEAVALAIRNLAAKAPS